VIASTAATVGPDSGRELHVGIGRHREQTVRKGHAGHTAQQSWVYEGVMREYDRGVAHSSEIEHMDVATTPATR
jgi:hypothetical protein